MKNKSPPNSEVLLGTFWELGEPFWNLMGTYREHNGDKEKSKKILPPPSQNNKTGPLMCPC